MIPARRVTIMVVLSFLVGAASACGSSTSQGASVREKAIDSLPTMSLDPEAVEVMPSAVDLIRNSYVVARGQFENGPTVVSESPEGDELAAQLVVWEFVPEAIYRDVRVDDAPAKVAEEERGSILVAARANEVGKMRANTPIEQFIANFPSVYNLNSFPLNRPLYIFLRPGAMPREVVQRNESVSHVMGVTELTHCYLVEELDRACSYVADSPGGEPAAVLGEGSMVPRDLTAETIERAGSVAEVVGYMPHAEVDPTIDARRFEVVVGEGSEG